MQMPSSRRIRQILAVAILVPSVALVAVVALRQLHTTPPEQVSRPASPAVDMAMTRLHFSEMQNDATRWELTAQQADYAKAPGAVQLSGVRLETFEGKSGGVVVTARTGAYQEEKRLVQLRGEVHAVTRRGMVFDTDLLEYRPAAGMLQTDRPVTVQDGRLQLRALGMDASLKDEQVRFLHRVEAVIEGNHGKP